MNDLLEFDSLNLRFGERRILSGIYMQCRQGEVVGLLGRNGSGKSSLMKVVFGAHRADHKSVRINDQSLGDNYLRKRIIAYLPQEGLIPSYISIHEAFTLFKVDMSGVTAVFPQINDLTHHKPNEVSGGMLRLIEALLILYSPSPFCILDEPFTGLMPVHIESLKEIIAQAKRHKGIIISDHMHRHVTELSGKLYLLSNGSPYEVKGKEQLVEMGYLSGL